VRVGVYAAFVPPAFFYYFVLGMAFWHVAVVTAFTITIATAAIEGAFKQGFRSRKRVSYPRALLTVLSTADDTESAAESALETITYLLRPRAAVLALNGEEGRLTIHAAAGMSQAEAETLVESISQDLLASQANEQPREVARETLPEVLDQRERHSAVVIPLVALQHPIGAVLLVAEHRNVDIRDVHLLGSIGTALALSLENLRQKQRLNREREHFKRLLENGSDFIAIIDGIGRITYISPSVSRMLGYGPDELLGQVAFQFLHPDDLREAAERFAQRVSERQPGVESQIRFRTKDGGWRLLHAVSDYSRIDDPSIGGIVVNARDITESEEAAEILRRSEERYRNLVESAQDAIYTLNPDGTIASLNPAFERLTGWERSEWAGKSFVPLVHPDDLPAAMQQFQTMIAGETTSTYELRIRCKSGDYKVAEFVSSPLVENGVVTAVQGIARDVTDRKLAEDRLRSSQAQLAEAQHIAHIGSWEWDIGTGAVTWTDELYRIHGLEPRDAALSYEEFLAVVHPDEREHVDSIMRAAFGSKEPFDLDYRITTPSGEERTIHGRGQVLTDEAGDVVGMVGTA
jgi:PAS domain S-box-containing protein